MKRYTFLILVAILAFSAISINAQLGSIKKIVKDKNRSEKKAEKSTKSNSSNEYLFVGKDGLDGEMTSQFKVCESTGGSFESPLKTKFKQWYSDISTTAQEKLYAKGSCQLMCFQIKDNRSYKYRNVDSLETLAQGASAYKVEGEKLVLVKDFTADSMYVVVVPQVNKPGLKLADLRLGVTPDLKNTYRKKTAGVFNYHNLDQAVYIFKKYKANPSPYETNSVLFSSKDFKKLNKQGKFKGLIIYKLIGDELKPAK